MCCQHFAFTYASYRDYYLFEPFFRLKTKFMKEKKTVENVFKEFLDIQTPNL